MNPEDEPLTFANPGPEKISFFIYDEEIIRLESGGFYFKGERINDDPEKVYEALSEFVKRSRSL